MTSQPLTKKNFVPGSLRRPRSPHTLLLRMAADDARAQRIRETWLERKAENPRKYTWGRIAAAVGTTERAAQDWQKTGGIDYDNAKKLAKYLSVDFDWLWRGDREEDETPDPFASPSDELRAQLARLEEKLVARTEHDTKIAQMLEQQTAILQQIERALKLTLQNAGLIPAEEPAGEPVPDRIPDLPAEAPARRQGA